MEDAATLTEGYFLTGDQVRSYRTYRGLTQKELGRWLGMTQHAVSLMERRGAKRVVALALAAVDRGLQPWTPDKEKATDLAAGG